jgi:hypothetical protein
MKRITPGTVAAIAATLIGQGENLSENGEFFSPHWQGQRRNRIKQFVRLAAEICHESEILHGTLTGEPLE